MKRAKTCAVVMKRRVDDPGATTSDMADAALRLVSTKFAWVSMQPRGRPVVPEV